MEEDAKQRMVRRIGRERFGSVLLISPAGEHENARRLVVEQLCNEDQKEGLYVTMRESHRELIDEFKREGINAGRLYFIDANSWTGWDEAENRPQDKAENCTLVRRPVNLAELSLATSGLVAGNQHQFLIFDSFNELAAEFTLPLALRFTQYLLQNLSLHEMDAVVLCRDDAALEKAIRAAVPLADDVIAVGEAQERFKGIRWRIPLLPR
jgi:hypothetical protein